MPASGLRAVVRAAAIVLLCLWAPARAAGPECPSHSVGPAIVDVQKVVDWAGLHDVFRRYRGCDDGAIAEVYSERVVELLSGKWGNLPQLAPFVDKDGDFAVFVLRHIDATADPKDLERIIANVRGQGCPGLPKAFCGKIRTQAEATLDAVRAAETPKK